MDRRLPSRYRINKHHIGYEAQLAGKCLFTPTFSAGDFDP